MRYDPAEGLVGRIARKFAASLSPGLAKEADLYYQMLLDTTSIRNLMLNQSSEGKEILEWILAKDRARKSKSPTEPLPVQHLYAEIKRARAETDPTNEPTIRRGMKVGKAYSRANECWFMRVYPFQTEAEVDAALERFATEYGGSEVKTD